MEYLKYIFKKNTAKTIAFLIVIILAYTLISLHIKTPEHIKETGEGITLGMAIIPYTFLTLFTIVFFWQGYRIFKKINLKK
jgi:hypothetical protein